MVIEVIGLLEGDGTVYLKERNSMVIEVIGLLEGDGHCVAE